MGSSRSRASRRVVLAGAVGAGAAGATGALAGCEVYGREPASPGGDGAGGTVVASAADVEVGGGLIVQEHNVVITQPAADTFKAFSATCTHQGCTVASVADGTINCECHGSQFSIEDGSVVQAASGLSPEEQDPLPEAGITVEGGEITLA